MGKSFEFSIYTGYDLPKEKALTITELERRINQSIRLSDYGTGVERIIYCPIVLPENDQMYEEDFSYDARKKELSGRIKLDYKKALSLKKDEYLDYLKGGLVEMLGRFNKMDDFNCPNLQKSVDQILL